MVSTDGSCLRNPGGAIGWAWVNHQGESNSGGEESGTNQIAELRALLEAILAHPGDEPMMIESDSQYAIKCASEWLPGWKRKGWKTANGSPVKNLDLVQAIEAAITARTGPVRFRWVRGHVGNHYNEMADKLAGEAAREVKGRPRVAPPVAPAPAIAEPTPVAPVPGPVPKADVRPPVFAEPVQQELALDLDGTDDALTLF